ncbi:MAG: PLP-dependent aminotransferase family protein [Alphaproteobacteria bacterium]|nr:PLP-dependent aminotransferase family protein [Alphaproteobacteria bacterium]MBO6627293.1 PLP-dependent aminotransferase family protein [Alphaproteobacteria bacterium]MDF1626528.1 PLP-dependent aminotransferase family protein [Parvibaculaceae bacterium]
MPQSIALVEPINLDRNADRPLQWQLYESLRLAILDGRLTAGQRLPSSRALANDLSLGRNTVVAAYEQLAAEGYVLSKTGAGTEVAALPPETVLEVGRSETAGRAQDPRRTLSKRGETTIAIRRASPFYEKLAALPFQHGLPAMDSFPRDTWARLLARRARQPQSRLYDYQFGPGFPALREAIAAYLGAARGVVCGPQNVIVTAGAQAALDLAARMVIDPGDPVWVEDPGYLGARGALTSAGANLIPVPVDEEGINTEALPTGTPAPKLIYVSPSYQFPLGVTMSLPRRLALLERAKETGAWILEDDYDSEYRYTGRPLAALQGLDGTGGVIYMGTFAKTLFPALRVGYLVVPDSLIDAFTAAIRMTGQSPPPAIQAALADFMDDGHFTAHIRRMRTLYAGRQQHLIDALDRETGEMFTVPKLEGGMQLAAYLNKGDDDAKAVQTVTAAKVFATALSSYYLNEPKKHGLYLGYAGVLETDIDRAAKKLGRAMRDAGF